MPLRRFTHALALGLCLAWSTSAHAAGLWWDGFGAKIVDGSVKAITYYNSDLYIGGSFNTIDGQISYPSDWLTFAQWNGTNWVPISIPGNTVPGAGAGVVEAMTVYQGELYVGAKVGRYYGAPSDNIVKWNGTNWGAVGSSGVDGKVLALLTSGTDLYAGGDFVSADGNTVNHIARWDGTAWQALGDGLDGQVVALTEYQGHVVAAGSFHASGTTTLPGAALWDGTSWQPVGDQSLGSVYGLGVFNGILIAGGSFSLQGGSSLAWLDGNSWKLLGGGTNGWVRGLTVAGGKLYVAGGFSTVGKGGQTLPANTIAAWDGTSWSALGSGITSVTQLYTLASYGTDVLVGGAFNFAGGASAVNIAVWKGNYWDNSLSKYGKGLDQSARVLLSDDSSVIVGGGFTIADEITVNRIARWDGNWHPYGDGFNGNVFALCKYGTDLIAGGIFSSSGTTPVARIGRWNGSSWDPVGGGADGAVWAMVVYNGDLIAAGDFSNIGGQPASRIARWDGTAWHPLGVGGIDGTPSLLVAYNGNLVVGGDFIHIGGIVAPGLAQWDGTSWSTVGGGLYSQANAAASSALAVFQGNLYVTGQFQKAGGANGVVAPNVARWNGTNWSAMGSLPANTAPLTDYFGTLLAGFSAWNGSAWYTYTNPSPIDGPVYAMLAHDGSNVRGLFVGGFFTTIADTRSSNIALYDPIWSSTGIGDETLVQRLNAFPNPFHRSLSITFSLESQKNVQVAVFDIAGRRVATLLDKTLPAGTHEATWDARNVKGQRAPAGVYFVRVQQGEHVDSRQIVLVD